MFRAVANEETDSKSDSRKLLLATSGLVRVRAGKSGKYLVVDKIFFLAPKVFSIFRSSLCLPEVKTATMSHQTGIKGACLEYKMTRLLTHISFYCSQRKVSQVFLKVSRRQEDSLYKNIHRE